MRGVLAALLLGLLVVPARAGAAEADADAGGEAAAREETGAGETAAELPGERLPAPRLSDRPFRPVAPARSRPRAERSCCDREH